MRTEKLADLRLRAMATARIYGCEAEIQETDNSPPDSEQAIIGIRVVVVRRSTHGAVLRHEANVRLAREGLAEGVAAIVRRAAAELPDLGA